LTREELSGRISGTTHPNRRNALDHPVNTDRTVRILLGLIAAALFANLLRPSLEPHAAMAAPAAVPAPGLPAIALQNDSSGKALVVQGGSVYQIDDSDGLKVVGRVPLK
jgi:hypothetical protein